MFETSLIDAAKPRRTPHILATAAGLHFAVFATVVSAAYWHIGPVSEPMENAVFIMHATLPPPPAAGSRAQAPAPVPTKPVVETKREVVQPKDEDVAKDIPPAAAPSESTPPADVVPNSVMIGGPGGPGVPGSPGNGDGPDSGFDGPGRSEVPGPAVVSDQPYRLTGAIARPVLLSRIEPLYPEPARRAHQGGTVILQTVIDESGRVIDVTVVKGLGFGLQQAAIDAVSKWRFKPATMNGRAVKVFFNLTVQFSLN